jgi:periplasmic protein TonB
VKHVTPVYPAAARDAKIAGVVMLEAVIGADERIVDVQVVRSIPELDQAAIDAVNSGSTYLYSWTARRRRRRSR